MSKKKLSQEDKRALFITAVTVVPLVTAIAIAAPMFLAVMGLSCVLAAGMFGVGYSLQKAAHKLFPDNPSKQLPSYSEEDMQEAESVIEDLV